MYYRVESGAPQKPIYERLGEVQRSKREKLHNLQVQVEEEQKPTFKPYHYSKNKRMKRMIILIIVIYVNPYSRKIVESRRQSIGEVHSEGEQSNDGEDEEESKMTRSVSLFFTFYSFYCF